MACEKARTEATPGCLAGIAASAESAKISSGMRVFASIPRERTAQPAAAAARAGQQAGRTAVAPAALHVDEEFVKVHAEAGDDAAQAKLVPGALGTRGDARLGALPDGEGVRDSAAKEQIRRRTWQKWQKPLTGAEVTPTSTTWPLMFRRSR